MAFSIVTKDGIEISGIPDGTPKDDQRLKDQVAQLRASGQKSAPFGGAPAATEPEQPDATTDQPNKLVMTKSNSVDFSDSEKATVRGLARGAGSTVGIFADPLTALMNMALPEQYRGMPVDQGIQVLLEKLGVDEPQTKAAQIVEAASMGLGSSLSTMGTGALMAAGAPAIGAASKMQSAGRAIASGPMQQVAGDIGSNVGAKVAEQQGASPLVQFGAGLAGGVAGSTAANAVNLRPATVPHPMQETVDASGKLRTQLMTSDVFPPKTFAGKTGQALAEKIPLVGTGQARANQQADRIADVKDILRQFGANDAASASDEVMMDLVTKRKDNFRRWEGMKEEALKAVEDAKPGESVPMTKTMKQIDDSIAYLKKLNNPDLEPAMQKLSNAKQSFQNQTPSNVLKNKQILGDIFDAPEMGALKRTASSELKKTYEAVKDDLTNFIGEAGGQQAKNKWGIANAEETKLFKELELGILESTLEKGVDRPEVVKNMLFNKDKSVIQALNKNLTAKGREAARAAIMQEVGKKIGEDASPEKFLTEMRKMKSGGDPVGVFFSGDDMKAIEGLTRVLKATTRAPQAALNPPTGVQAVIPLSLIGMGGGSVALEKLFGQGLTGIIGSAALAGGAGLAARAYESPAVRNILMQLPSVKAGSVEEAALFKRLLAAGKTVDVSKTPPEDLER